MAVLDKRVIKTYPMEFEHEYFETVPSDGEHSPAWEDEEDSALRMKFKLGQLGVMWNTKKREYVMEDKGQHGMLIKPSPVDKRIFECQSKIKKIISHRSLLIIADSIGNIYVAKDIKSRNRVVSRVNLGYFNIADVAVFDEKVLSVSKTSFIIKEVDIKKVFGAASETSIFEKCSLCSCDNECSCSTFTERSNHERQSVHNSEKRCVSDIMKDTGEKGYKKVHVCDKIYVLGEMLTVMDKNSYEIIYQIQRSIADFTVVSECLYCLAHNGDILVYKGKALTKKASFEDKFSYTEISGTEKVYLIAGNSIKILSTSLELVGERQCAFEVSYVAENDMCLAAIGDGTRSIKLLLKPLYKGVPNFPKSGVVFPTISCLAFDGNQLYYCHGRYVSSINIKSK